jgi:hypothetical protein
LASAEKTVSGKAWPIIGDKPQQYSDQCSYDCQGPPIYDTRLGRLHFFHCRFVRIKVTFDAWRPFVPTGFSRRRIVLFCSRHGNDKMIRTGAMTRATFTIVAIAFVCGAAGPPVTFESPCSCRDNHGKHRWSVKIDSSHLCHTVDSQKFLAGAPKRAQDGRMKTLPQNIVPFALRGLPPLDKLDQSMMRKLRKLADLTGWTVEDLIHQGILKLVTEHEAEKELETKIIRFPAPMPCSLQSENQINAHLRSSTA